MGVENELSEENPPMSRLFIICGKSITEDEIRDEFQRFGKIERLWLVLDKNTKENKGVAYIKFAKTSDAATALEEMNGKTLKNDERPIKVFVASSRSAGVPKKDRDEERYLRLFIVVGKTATKEDIKQDFEGFGEIDTISIVRNKVTKESKGVAYVKYKKFKSAARAFEECPRKYKAVFAAPRRTEDDSKYETPLKKIKIEENSVKERSVSSNINDFLQLKNVSSNPTTLEVISSKILNQDQLWRLFDVIPGLDYCQIIGECGVRNQTVDVVYNNFDSARYAKEKLHGLEYPVGERLIVKIRSEPERQTNNSAKDWFCNVKLKPPQPVLDSDAFCEARLFIVLASSVPVPVLKEVFCTFGSLIDVYLLHNKNCGYVRYGSTESAEAAIKALNDAEICGVKIKVMIAEAPKNSHADEDRK